MREIAEKRIKACDQAVVYLREAAALTAEAARMEKQAATPAPAPPPTKATKATKAGGN
jgi:hypothetical protein